MSELPEDTKEVWECADLEAAYFTANQGKDGTVYLVKWWYGRPEVACVILPLQTQDQSEGGVDE